jgi:hypothetical protein
MGNKAFQSERARTSKGSKVPPIAVVENNSKEESRRGWRKIGSHERLNTYSEVEIFDLR